MTFQAQLTIPYFNALPRDCSTNVLHFNWFSGIGPGDTEFAALTDAIELFYEQVYAGAESWAPYAVPALGVKWYDLTDPVPRSPVYETSRVLTVSMGGTAILPPEVAVVASVHAGPATGIPVASRRGRVYLGVLGNGVVTAGDIDQFPTVSEAFRVAVNGAANLLVGNAAAAGFIWCIYSRVHATGYPIIGGHCDDAFDTQRRRGQEPTIRNNWGS